MALKKYNGIYQGVLSTSIAKIDGITDYLNKIKEDHKINKDEKAAYFYLKNEGEIITYPENGKFSIMCNNLSEEVAKKLEELV